MSSAPWVAFYPSDWLAGTRGLTAAETGIYITLIALMYEREQPLDMPHPRLARLCGCAPVSFSRALKTLIDEGKISDTASGLWNNRVQKELSHRKKVSDEARNSANARWEKSAQKQQAINANAMPPQCENHANHNHNHNHNHNIKQESLTGSEGAASVKKPTRQNENFEAQSYRRGKEVLGKSAGGMITKLKHRHDGDWQSVLDVIEQAADKGEPRVWLAKILNGEEGEQTPKHIEDEIYRNVL